MVNSYHLLLSCVDFIYGNAVMAKRTDLLNESFDSGIGDPESKERTEPPCILDALCKVHDGIINEVKTIREHYWKPRIRMFFESKVCLPKPRAN